MRSVVFVCPVNDEDVFARRLSGCDGVRGHPLRAMRGCRAAADVNVAFSECPKGGIVVYVHQDVSLPAGWADRLLAQWGEAERRYGPVGVAGVYGVKTTSPDPRVRDVRAGHLLDRGRILRELTGLPFEVDALDECVLAVDASAGLRIDPALGWHFYGADLCLQAQARGLRAVAVDAYCEHWSAQSRHGFLPAGYAESREAFRIMWSHRLPIVTCNERVAA